MSIHDFKLEALKSVIFGWLFFQQKSKSIKVEPESVIVKENFYTYFALLESLR